MVPTFPTQFSDLRLRFFGTANPCRAFSDGVEVPTPGLFPRSTPGESAYCCKCGCADHQVAEVACLMRLATGAVAHVTGVRPGRDRRVTTRPMATGISTSNERACGGVSPLVPRCGWSPRRNSRRNRAGQYAVQ
jgi:hypothetical protein